MDNEGWKALLGQTVVVDTNSRFVYLGTLARVEDRFVVLTDADAHDRHEGPSTKEHYVVESRKYGIRPNRREVSIRKTMVVSVSRLDDVVLY